MAKITKIENGKYIGGNKYTIKDAGDGKSTIDFTPDTVLQAGTAVGAEVLNEIQKNSVYCVNGVHKIEGQEEIYDVEIEGIADFEFETLQILMTPSATNTKKGPYVRLNGAKYIMRRATDTVEIGDLVANEPILVNLDFSKKNANVSGTLVGELKKTNEAVDGNALAIEKNKWFIQPKEVGDRDYSTDILELCKTLEPGFYASPSLVHEFTNLPPGMSNAFSLIITTIGGNYKLIKIRNYNSNLEYLNTYYPSTDKWIGWSKVYNEAYKPTASEIGAVSNKGGIVEGNIILKGEDYSITFKDYEGNLLGYISSDSDEPNGLYFRPGKQSSRARIYNELFPPTPKEVGSIPINNNNGTPVAFLYSDAQDDTGLGTRIRTPFKPSDTKMASFIIRVYQNYESYDIRVSGYLYASKNNWHNAKVDLISGTTPIQIKLGVDENGYGYIWLQGDRYRGVGVFNVVNGYQNTNWNEGWTISKTNTTPNVALDTTLYPPYSPHNKPTTGELNVYSKSESDSRYRRVIRKVVGNPTIIEYSDGYKEAWGQLTTPDDETYREYTLPVTFSSMNYSLSTSYISKNQGSDITVTAECNKLSTNKIKYRTNTASDALGTIINWKVSGY